MKNKLLYIILFILLSSCIKKRTIDEKILGSWMIEEFNYKKLNYKDSLDYNMLFFEVDKKVKIPEISIFKKEVSSWNIEKRNESYFLNINSNNAIFNGKYNIEFIKNDEKQILGVKLKSEELNILAYKFGQDYLVDGLNW